MRGVATTTVPGHEKVGRGALKTLVLLVLALAWGTVLFFWLRSRQRDPFEDSVGLFHRHLNVLQRTGPTGFAPANRLRVPEHHQPLVHRRAALNSPIPRAVAPRGAVSRGSSAQVMAQTRLRQTRRRRRDVLFALVILVVATFVVAAVTGASKAIVAQLTMDIVLVVYVAMLVRIRNLAAERDLKLRVMYPQQPQQLQQLQPVHQPRAARAQRPVRQPRRRPEPEYDYEFDENSYEGSGSYSLPGYGLASSYAMAAAPDLRRVAISS
jgi:hypothetical protein